jgi:hypothetical protein
LRSRELLAHLPYDEALRLARQRPGAVVDETAFRKWWEISQVVKAGRADTWSTPAERELEAGCEDYLAEVTGIPQAAAMGTRPWSVRIVDLRKVVGFQIQIVEERVVVPPGLLESSCDLLKFSLRRPTKRRTAIVDGPGENQITLSAQDVNLRVVGQLRADAPLGPAFGFVIGGGLPWIQVVAFGGRHVLRDGYHRAVGLLRSGIYEVPVARVEGATPADIGIQPGFFPIEAVLGAQPPLLTDFLDDRLSQVGPTVRQMKVVRITAEQFLLPIIDDEGESKN